MKRVKVSIITVVYNGAETIEQTIQSVIHQTYDNIEYIIIDGASTDGTCDIVKKYKDEVKVFISEPDSGLYYAMNKGIHYATGEIVGIINSDDLYSEDAVSKVVECFEKNEADIVYGNAQWFDDDGIGTIYTCRNIESLWYQMSIPHPATFIKKEVYQTDGVFDTQYSLAADYDLILRFYSKKKKFVYLDAVLTYFRKGGLSAKKESECMEEAKKISLSYFSQSNNKERTLKKIEQYYYLRKFQLLYFNNEQSILDGIRKFLNNSMDKKEIVVFGTGKWGERCFQMIHDSGRTVDFFVDNNSMKWGTKVLGIIVKEPSELIGYKGNILVATYEYEEEIKNQLNILDWRLQVYSLADLAERAVKNLD